MGGPFEGNWRQSWQEAHIAGCRPRISRPAEPADTDPCGEGRAGNQCGRSPTGNPTAVRPLSPTGSEGNRTYRERGCGASVRSEGNQGVRVMGERRYRTSATIKLACLVNGLAGFYALARLRSCCDCPQDNPLFQWLTIIPIRVHATRTEHEFLCLHGSMQSYVLTAPPRIVRY